MPLSRLSPRGTKKGIAQRCGSRRQDAQRRAANAAQHLSLWDAIQKTREELEQWQTRADEIDELFRRIILPREHQLTDVFCRLTQKLLQYFEVTPMADATKSLLGLWITENLHTIAQHPFVPAQRYTMLSRCWFDLIKHEGPIENQLLRLAEQRAIFRDWVNLHESDSGHSAEQNSANQADRENTVDDDDEDVIFDFGWHRKSSYAREQPRQNTRADQENNEPSQKTSSEPGTPPEDSEQLEDRISGLQKNLSIERLFRQLARVLHPDKEQDEAIRATKHILMSECLIARQNKDIHAMLTLYCEHVGDLPDELSTDSYAELVIALQQQLKRVQAELRNQCFGNPLRTQIVERYGAPDSLGREQNIARHARSLDSEIAALTSTHEKLDSFDGLEMALQQRRSIELDRMAIDEMTGLS